MRKLSALLFLLMYAGCSAAPATPGIYAPAARAADSVAALDAFRSNIAAIHDRDRAAYLQHYLESPRLARVGPAGIDWGYEGLAAADPDAWPDTLIATDLEVVPVAPGVAYGAYRYRVVSGGSERGVSERVLVEQPDGSWKIVVSTAFGSSGNRPVPPVAFIGATIIDGTGAPAREGTIVVRDGKIDCVGDCGVMRGTHTIDATGKWIMPGLVDAHVHFSQTGWADGRPDALDMRDRFPYHQTIAKQRANPERYYRSYLCSGVTAVFDVGGFPWTWDLRTDAEQSNASPHVAAAGPLLSAIDHWLNLPAERQFIHMSSEEATREGAEMIVSHDSDAVKVWYIVTPSADTVALKSQLRAGAQVARAAGIPLIVHATSLWAAKDALRAGATLLVHSVEDQPVDEEFLQLAREAGATYNPTLTVRRGYVQLAQRDFRPDYDLACVDPETRELAALTNSIPGDPPSDAYLERIERGYRMMLDNLQTVHAAGIPVAMGTDAGNPLTLHGPSVYSEMEAMVEAGLSEMDVIVASTRNGARAMGRDDLGTLQPGMIADFIILDDNPLERISNVRELALVVRGGEVWTRKELEAAPAARGY